MKEKPHLSFWQIWNLSFGFIGIQIGYSLQGANTSRILSALGADPSHLPLFWVVAPIAGLIIQPLVGSSSDRTWNRLGRRIPYMLAGSIIASLSLIIMPNSELVVAFVPPVLFGVFMILIIDASLNITMQPFRSLVGDMVNNKQRNLGYSIQAFLTSVGAVIGSLLPFLISYMGIRNMPNASERVAPSVIWAFYIGAGLLLPTVLWTCFRVKEYSPKLMAKYERRNIERKNFKELLKSVPKVMYQLAIVQFFSWFALFLFWVYATNAFGENIWHTKDYLSQAYNEAGNWNGVLSAVYAVSAAIFSLFIAQIIRSWNRKKLYATSLLVGAITLLSLQFINNQYMLIIPMLGFGIAWAGILSLPYAILSQSVPDGRMGLFMGLFNISITVPQIVAGLTGGLLFKYVARENSMDMISLAGISLMLAALSVIFIQDKPETNNTYKTKI